MNLKMNLKKKLTVVTIALTLAMTQTGCLVGLVAWPLWIVGSVVGVTGGALTIIGAIDRDGPLLGSGIGLMVVGGVLDADNPGRADALNELPMTQDYAKAANVKTSDIRSYNHNLNQIRQVGLNLQNDIRTQYHRTDLGKYKSTEDLLTQDSEINKLAQSYGFESGQELWDTIDRKLKVIPRKNIKKFAENNKITEGEAKLLLYYGFAVKAE